MYSGGGGELAEDRLDAVKAQLAQGKSPASLRDAGKATFAAVADEWLAGRHDLKPRTRAEYANLLTTKTRARKDGDDNPAVHVKLPTERTLANSTPGVVDDPDMFLSAGQVAALVDATPWPCAVMVHLAASSGLRAAELAGLQVGTVFVRVRRTVIAIAGGETTASETATATQSARQLTYDTTKTKNSDRRVPLMPNTAQLLRDYLTEHPRADDPQAPLFCAVTLTPFKPTGKRAELPTNASTDLAGDEPAERKPLTAAQKADRQATALAALSVAEATERLALDWSRPLSHQTFYKAVFRPAVLRANRLALETSTHRALAGHGGELLPPRFKFHGLRHTYARPVRRCRYRRGRGQPQPGALKGHDDAGHLHTSVPYR